MEKDRKRKENKGKEGKNPKEKRLDGKHPDV